MGSKETTQKPKYALVEKCNLQKIEQITIKDTHENDYIRGTLLEDPIEERHMCICDIKNYPFMKDWSILWLKKKEEKRKNTLSSGWVGCMIFLKHFVNSCLKSLEFGRSSSPSLSPSTSLSLPSMWQGALHMLSRGGTPRINLLKTTRYQIGEGRLRFGRTWPDWWLILDWLWHWHAKILSDK